VFLQISQGLAQTADGALLAGQQLMAEEEQAAARAAAKKAKKDRQKAKKKQQNTPSKEDTEETSASLGSAVEALSLDEGEKALSSPRIDRAISSDAPAAAISVAIHEQQMPQVHSGVVEQPDQQSEDDATSEQTAQSQISANGPRAHETSASAVLGNAQTGAAASTADQDTAFLQRLFRCPLTKV